jgi:hypothetical protein
VLVFIIPYFYFSVDKIGIIAYRFDEFDYQLKTHSKAKVGL